MCSLGIEPTTFALLMQCSTTEPQEHYSIEDTIVIEDTAQTQSSLNLFLFQTQTSKMTQTI